MTNREELVLTDLICKGTMRSFKKWTITLLKGKNTNFLPFQKGIFVSNESLRQMLPYIKKKYSTEDFSVQYILTRKLCQDVLENFFSYIRAMGGGYDHPSPVEFKNRMRCYILGKHTEYAISEGANIEIDNESAELFDLHYSKGRNTFRTS